MKTAGIVAAKAHQNGNRKSASSPRSTNTVQNIFLCIGGFYGKRIRAEELFKQPIEEAIRQKHDGPQHNRRQDSEDRSLPDDLPAMLVASRSRQDSAACTPLLYLRPGCASSPSATRLYGQAFCLMVSVGALTGAALAGLGTGPVTGPVTG